MNELCRSGIGITETDAGLAARLDFNEHQDCSSPFERAVGFGSGSGDGKGRCLYAGDTSADLPGLHCRGVWIHLGSCI